MSGHQLMYMLHTHDALPVNVNLQLPVLVEWCPHIQNVTCRASWSSTGGFKTDGNIIQLHDVAVSSYRMKIPRLIPHGCLKNTVFTQNVQLYSSK